MKNILIIIIALFAFASCTTSSTTGGPSTNGIWTIQCQAYKVTMPANDTTYLEDLDTYPMQTVQPEYYENLWGIKNYSWGYTFCDCWIKP